jgi:hypothetical protein
MTKFSKCFVQLLHFVVAVDQQQRFMSFCCESQPLATIRSYGLPSRCPFCQQVKPVSAGLTMNKNEEKV